MVTLLRIFTMLCLSLTACETFLKDKPSPKKALESVKDYSLQRDDVTKSLAFFTDSPHPMGSPRQIEVRDYLLAKLESMKLKPSLQSFTVDVPNRNFALPPASLTVSKQGFNVHTRLKLSENPKCVIALASHYDTKDMEAFAYLGANDSASTSVLLLDLASFLLKKRDALKLSCDVELIWFDGEEAVLEEWNDGLYKHPAHTIDNTYGSRHFAENLETCSCVSGTCLQNTETEFLSLILLDMLGYADLQVTSDSNSHPYLKSLLLEATESLDKKVFKTHPSLAIDDDHIPFKKKGIPVLNIIDFNHLNLWHTPHDRLETVSLDSLELSGRLALHVLLSIDPELLRKRKKLLCLKNL